jgi:hypothetical protein
MRWSAPSSDFDGEGRATHLRLGSEVDMGTPGFDPELGPLADATGGADTTSGATEPRTKQ